MESQGYKLSSKTKKLTVVIEEPNFSLIPEFGGMLCHPTTQIGNIKFLEQLLVPFSVGTDIVLSVGFLLERE